MSRLAAVEKFRGPCPAAPAKLRGDKQIQRQTFHSAIIVPALSGNLWPFEGLMAACLGRLADRKWASIPHDAGLYCLFLSNHSVYIGQTKHLRERLQTHLSVCVTQCLIGNFRVTPEIVNNLMFSVHLCASREKRSAMETWFISKYKPEFNSLISGKNSRITYKKENYYRGR